MSRSGFKDYLVVFSHCIKDILYTYKWYSWKSVPSYNHTAVAVVDGALYSGGMTDRFIGIISLYCWARSKKIQFKILYNSPFNLSDYIIPNKYNWIPDKDDYIRNVRSSKVLYAIGEPGVLRRLNKRAAGKKQIHFYGNRDLLPMLGIDDECWGYYFNYLFKTAPRLQLKLDETKKRIGTRYFSVCFRFQNLLGDFEEYGFHSLSSSTAKAELIGKCIVELERLQLLHPDEKCFVTADSINFLKHAIAETGCYCNEGSVVHMGSCSNGTYEQYERSFLDFFMLAGSDRVYNIVVGDMYPSGFPFYAAKLNNIPFERIVL